MVWANSLKIHVLYLVGKSWGLFLSQPDGWVQSNGEDVYTHSRQKWMLKEKTHPKLENLRNFEAGLGSSQGLYVFCIFVWWT